MHIHIIDICGVADWDFVPGKLFLVEKVLPVVEFGKKVCHFFEVGELIIVIKYVAEI